LSTYDSAGEAKPVVLEFMFNFFARVSTLQK